MKSPNLDENKLIVNVNDTQFNLYINIEILDFFSIIITFYKLKPSMTYMDP